MTMRLTLFRHGHTPWNALGRYQGHAPIPLSERGLLQAQYLAEVAGQIPADAIYSSDLLRCRMTAAPIADALGLSPQFDVRYRETDYGNWQGLTLAELAEVDAEAFAAYRADPVRVPVPGGESQQILARRVLDGLAEILSAHHDGHVLLVTHGGPIREILRYFDLWEGGLPAGNASRTVLLVNGNFRTATLQLRGDVSHLPSELRPDQSGTTFLVPK